MAPFSKEDKILIKSLYECKRYNAQQFITEFPGKGWTMRSLDRLLVKLRKFGTGAVHILMKTSTHALFSVCSLRDDNVITSKPTWKLKHTNSFLEYSEYFCQSSSKSLLVILSYTVLKFRRFFETQCTIHVHIQKAMPSSQAHSCTGCGKKHSQQTKLKGAVRLWGAQHMDGLLLVKYWGSWPLWPLQHWPPVRPWCSLQIKLPTRMRSESAYIRQVNFVRNNGP